VPISTLFTAREHHTTPPPHPPPFSHPTPPFAVLVGHGRRALGALIVPDAEALEELAAQQGQAGPLPEAAVRKLVGAEVRCACRERCDSIAAAVRVSSWTGCGSCVGAPVRGQCWG
jgi:hypothetical protein